MAEGYSHGVKRWRDTPHPGLAGIDPDAGAERLAAERKGDHVDPRVSPLLEMAWGLIANAHGGDWQAAAADWREAAERWRGEYHAWLAAPAQAGNPLAEKVRDLATRDRTRG